MSTAPVLLPYGQVLLAGKSRIVYLLDGAHLGGIGHQQATLGGGPRTITGSACGGDIAGGAAVVGLTVFLPCTSGIIAVRASRSPPALRLLWSSGIGGGPPIVAAGLVWTIGQNGVLYGLDPATGRVRQQTVIGDVYVEIGPQDADYPRLAAQALTPEEAERRRDRWQAEDEALRQEFLEFARRNGESTWPDATDGEEF